MSLSLRAKSGRELKDPLNLAVVTIEAAKLHSKRREPQDALALAEAVVALSEEYGLRDFAASGRSLRDLAAAELNQVDIGIDELEANVILHPSSCVYG